MRNYVHKFILHQSDDIFDCAMVLQSRFAFTAEARSTQRKNFIKKYFELCALCVSVVKMIPKILTAERRGRGERR